MHDIPVWSYWVGPLNPIMELCLESLRFRCPTITILDDSFWTNEYDGDIPADEIVPLQPVQKSELLRAYLLKERGGVWVDADCLAFRDLAAAADLLDDHDFVAYKLRGTILNSALTASKPGGKIVLEWWQELKSTHRRLYPDGMGHRLALGPLRLVDVLARFDPNECAFLPGDLIHPIFWQDWHLLHQESPGADPRPDAWCCMLTKRSLRAVRRWPKEMILKSDALIGRIVRRALGE